MTEIQNIGVGGIYIPASDPRNMKSIPSGITRSNNTITVRWRPQSTNEIDQLYYVFKSPTVAEIANAHFGTPEAIKTNEYSYVTAPLGAAGFFKVMIDGQNEFPVTGIYIWGNTNTQQQLFFGDDKNLYTKFAGSVSRLQKTGENSGVSINPLINAITSNSARLLSGSTNAPALTWTLYDFLITKNINDADTNDITADISGCSRSAVDLLSVTANTFTNIVINENGMPRECNFRLNADGLFVTSTNLTYAIKFNADPLTNYTSVATGP
jgi:hypothetical protein